MDTRRLRRCLASRDPVGLVLLVGAVEAEGSEAGQDSPRRHFGRARSREPEAVAVVVPEDAALEAADLLDLLACARRVDVAVPEAAADGPGEPMTGGVEALVSYAAERAAMCGRPGDIGVVDAGAAHGLPRIDPEHVPVGRRALIGASDRPLPEPAETPQRRLVDSVRGLLAASGRTTSGTESARPEPPLSGSAKLRAQGCCGDGLCVRVCPRDALRLEAVELETGERPGPPGVGAPPRTQSQFRLVQVAADCDGCDECVAMCPNGALLRIGDHSWNDLLEEREHALRTGWVRECSRCGAAHRQMGELCAVCKAQQENPFAVRLPPGMRGRR